MSGEQIAQSAGSSRTRGDLHIPRFSISVRAGVPHLAFRGKCHTLARRERGRSGAIFPSRDIRSSRPDSRRNDEFSERTATTGAGFFSRARFYSCAQRPSSRIISRPKFALLTRNFHARFPAARRIALNDAFAHARFFFFPFVLQRRFSTQTFPQTRRRRRDCDTRTHVPLDGDPARNIFFVATER